MADTIFVGTRKGLFKIERGSGSSYSITQASFVGDPVTMVLHDARDGTIYASIGHGHLK